MRTMLVAGLALLASPAHAYLIMLEADGYAVGTNLSNIQERASLSWLSFPDGYTGTPQLPARSDVYASTCYHAWCPPPTGTLGLGLSMDIESYFPCLSGSIACSGGRALEVNFANPVDFVQISFAYGSDPPVIHAFDTDGNRIGSCRNECTQHEYAGGPNGHYYATISFQTSVRQIARIVTGSDNGTAFADTLVYNVPEPGTLVLAASGLLAALVGRRRTVARRRGPSADAP